MGIRTFYTPAEMAVALKSGVAPGAAPGVTGYGTTQPDGAAPVVSSNAQVDPRFSALDAARQQSMADALIKGATATPVNGNFDGIGRMAQLVSGHYQQAKATAAENARNEQIAAKLGDSADLYRLGDSDTRKALLTGHLADQRTRANEERERAEAIRQGQILAGATDNEDLMQKALTAGNGKLVERATEIKLKQSEQKGALAHKINEYAHVIGGVDPRELAKTDPARHAEVMRAAKAQALGVPPDIVHGAKPSENADTYESARNAEEKKALFADSIKTHHEVKKQTEATLAQATRQMRVLDLTEGAINSGVYTGAYADQVNLMKKIGVGLGLDIKGVKDSELINSLSLEMARGSKQGWVGATSNMEFSTYLRSVVANENTPEGNRAILDWLRESAREQLAVAKDQHDWTKLRQAEGKPVLFSEGYQNFARQRAQERYEKVKEVHLAARAAAGLSPDGTPMSREEAAKAKLGQPAQRNPNMPQRPSEAKAAQPAAEQSAISEGTVIVNRKTGARMTYSNGQWQPVEADTTPRPDSAM